MLRQGSGEPLVLLHGVLGSERMWTHVVPLLAASHDVIAPTVLGHNGGRAPTTRPVGLADLVDDVERTLDELGLGAVDLAGNSLGGWIALELARRGRARSVCALSPAGAWEADWTDRKRVFATLERIVRDSRRARRVLPLVARSKRVRRYALRSSAVHGERVSAEELLGMVDDTIGCTLAKELLATDAQLAPLDPSPCPITLAWSGRDRLFPPALYGARAQQLIPGARFVVLDGVGHVPMLDDPRLVAETILSVTGAAAAAVAAPSR